MIRPSIFCQRWRERRDSYRPAGEPINPADYEIAPIGLTEAKSFVLQHHYSGSYPSCRFRFGLFTSRAIGSQLAGFSPELVGVAVFSVPQHPRVLTNVFGGDFRESLELGRFVLLDHVPANGETWFKARCLELLPGGLRGIVAFSDDQPRVDGAGRVLFAGHIGNIYQASNAVFLGRGSSKTLHLFADGTTFERRTMAKIKKRDRGWKYAAQILIDRGASEPGDDLLSWLNTWLPQLTRAVHHPGNLKYAWSLDRSIRLPDSLPYPKRDACINGVFK